MSDPVRRHGMRGVMGDTVINEVELRGGQREDEDIVRSSTHTDACAGMTRAASFTTEITSQSLGFLARADVTKSEGIGDNGTTAIHQAGDRILRENIVVGIYEEARTRGSY